MTDSIARIVPAPPAPASAGHEFGTPVVRETPAPAPEPPAVAALW